MQASLQQIFHKYTSDKPEMDGKTFAKLAKDCHLLDKKLTPTDVDLKFAKVKTSSAVRTINYQQFEKGVNLMAEKKGITSQEIQNLIINAGGPQFQGTKADAVKFHDDKSLYTGVHANGGPTTVDKNQGLQSVCNRGAADVRGVNK